MPPSTEIRTGLKTPDAYPHEVQNVEVIETHISWVFLADQHVYKVKKPVCFPFLDFSTLEKRRFWCEEELRLNRRLSPDIYRGLVAIRRDSRGHLRLFGDGEVVDYAVEMSRLPRALMMDRLLDQKTIDNEKMNQLATLLAAFHQRADGGGEVQAFATEEAIQTLFLENLDELASLVIEDQEKAITETSARFLRQSIKEFLETNRPLFEERLRKGRIRDGHGDLHAANICFAEDGIKIYDCLEFSKAFRAGDVALDLAFLAMDLDVRGYRAFSAYLVHAYEKAAGDPDVHRLMAFYKVHRALVRSKVHILQASSSDISQEVRRGAIDTAHRYVHLAMTYFLPPSLILMCGLPGSGKSWFAQRLAAPFEAVVLRSDVRRKQLHGVDPTDHSQDASKLYSPEASDATFASLLSSAKEHLEHGRTVIVDASFGKPHRRAPFLEWAQSSSLSWLLVEATCPPEKIEERLRQRQLDRHEASDADIDVYRRMRSDFEEPHEVDPPHRLRLESDGSLETSITTVLEALAAQARRGTR